MNENTAETPRRPVAVLREDVARKIAAGEIIDRPASVVRELLDNSLDSGADRIEVRLEEGGLSLVEVADDGIGMTRGDLDLCWHPHATSKIVVEDDLDRISTLGFRGEALSSIAAVSRLEITSRERGADLAFCLKIDGGQPAHVEAAARDKGTRVLVRDLFYNLPARKKFMKRSSAEAAVCRSTLIEKALPFPGREFVLTTEGRERVRLPRCDGPDAKIQRVVDSFGEFGAASLFWLVEGGGEGFSFELVLGTPGIIRPDRKFIFIYANDRRIQEYSLVQAVEYGYQGYLPGGSYPAAFVFLRVDPQLIDFNIHPAKREARFRNLPEIHRGISRAVQAHLFKHAAHSIRDQSRAGLDLFGTDTGPAGGAFPRRTGHSQGAVFDRWADSGRSGGSDREDSGNSEGKPAFFERAVPGTFGRSGFAGGGSPGAGFGNRHESGFRPNAAFDLSVRYEPGGAAPPLSGTDSSGVRIPYRFRGQVFGLFLLVELPESLVLIDMHAAHERIIFDRLRSKAAAQKLLIPLEIEISNDAEAMLAEIRGLGFDGKIDGNTLVLTHVPAGIEGSESFAAEFFAEFTGSPEVLERELYARIACRQAVKDGDPVSDETAAFIIEGALALENPRCPHGRPVWFELTREELYKLVGRT